ncbi:monovalent cation/H(+) antiporter subunit G [Nesterenkonia aurantiaca]|uniref:Multisubunit sodium/proton antiporter MrpG subunit n=1 Tax=Nesterenkonia aurantiaca TaxID=1436010 RepID=A0A4R7G8L9_9MICC|nr:monovalent cation/H(+) antiporter subunit G [Nesterenkonia aurantiaca]TDS87797.1 multisubunit sodium/proton antiporter MrpG subunit [Nesterenkonia aurantiaca]
MSQLPALLALTLILAGAFFFTVGTLGLIRFPDLRSRLHALTKADNLGLGLVLAGVALLLGSWTGAAVLALAWVLALAAASISAHVLGGLDAAEPSRERQDDPRTRPTRESPDSPETPS